MMARGLVPVLMLSLCFLGGCAEPLLHVGKPSAPPPAKEYPKVLDRWTRIGRVHSFAEWDTPLLISATLRAPEYQEAYLARYFDLYRILDQAERDRHRSQAKEQEDKGLQFLVRTAGHNYNWADLTSDRKYWRMVLMDDSGAEVAPLTIESIKVRETLEAELYMGPFAGSRTSLFGGPEAGTISGNGIYTRTYHVTFPKQRPDGKPLLPAASNERRRLILRVAGPQGKTDLIWTLTS